MTVHFFEGAAGTGKTFQLMKELEATLAANPLGERQKVLALSKMHGSRRRLMGRLSSVPGLGRRFECMTMDAFARNIVLRWRSLATLMFGDEPPNAFEEWCRRGAELLALPVVSSWVAATFPFTVIDEIQDSKGEQLKIMQSLSRSGRLIVAGDGFQDLFDEGDNEAVAWAREAGEATALTSVHRTSDSGLLAAAHALRNGSSVPRKVAGFEVVGVPVADLGAWHAARFIAGRNRGDSVVLLSPTNPTNPSFAQDLTHRLAAAPIGKKEPKLGPYDLPWEKNDEERVNEIVVRIGLASRERAPAISATELSLGAEPAERELKRWLDHQRRTRGLRSFTPATLRDAVIRIVQRLRAHGRQSRRFAAMTIHQAKNQEFDDVVVVWPHKIRGNAESQRRLLYNAVTRAKKRAIVIVQNNPKKLDRLARAPFVP